MDDFFDSDPFEKSPPKKQLDPQKPAPNYRNDHDDDEPGSSAETLQTPNSFLDRKPKDEYTLEKEKVEEEAQSTKEKLDTLKEECSLKKEDDGKDSDLKTECTLEKEEEEDTDQSKSEISEECSQNDSETINSGSKCSEKSENSEHLDSKLSPWENWYLENYEKDIDKIKKLNKAKVLKISEDKHKTVINIKKDKENRKKVQEWMNTKAKLKKEEDVRKLKKKMETEMQVSEKKKRGEEAFREWLKKQPRPESGPRLTWAPSGFRRIYYKDGTRPPPPPMVNHKPWISTLTDHTHV